MEVGARTFTGRSFTSKARAASGERVRGLRPPRLFFFLFFRVVTVMAVGWRGWVAWWVGGWVWVLHEVCGDVGRVRR